LVGGVAVAAGTAEAATGLPGTGIFTIVVPMQDFRPDGTQATYSFSLYRGSSRMMTAYLPDDRSGLAMTVTGSSYRTKPYFLLGRPGTTGVRMPDPLSATRDKQRRASLAYGYPSHAPYGSPWRPRPPRQASPAVHPQPKQRVALRHYYLALLKRYERAANRREAWALYREITALYRSLTRSPSGRR